MASRRDFLGRDPGEKGDSACNGAAPAGRAVRLAAGVVSHNSREPSGHRFPQANGALPAVGVRRVRAPPLANALVDSQRAPCYGCVVICISSV
jgi:hypothetical protein